MSRRPTRRERVAVARIGRSEFPTTRSHARESVLGAALRNAAHLGVLSSFAVAQPMLDILGRNPAFFAVRGSTGSEIVLLALALTLGPPLVLVTIELTARALDRTVAQALHFVFVGALAGVLALYVLTKAEALSGAVAVAVAAAFGACAALAYAKAAAARSLLSVLVPAPIVFVALFLLHSPVSMLVLTEAPKVRAANVEARTPVVLVVFDEFDSASLMNRRQEIDRERFPNFAALARDSLWFRDATTMYWLSEVAVPSILTGLRPDPRRLPVASEYPRNLFTLLGGSYRLVVLESLTHLCPRSLCRETRAAQGQAVSGEAGSLLSDVGIVYLHLLLPDPYVDRVPPIEDSWGDFGRAEAEGEEPARRSAGGEIEACARNICRFAELLSADRRPTLYFLDTLLPHAPYAYLPSGSRYGNDFRRIPGIEDARWTGDAWLTQQGYQRHLLQLGYTDSALGVILRRLRATGLYDRALVIVSADHGVSFIPNEPRRLVTAGNLHEIAFVPLFVKLPRQRSGRVVDGFARTIDVLPTVADVLGIRSTWRFDGRSLFGRRLPRDGSVVVRGSAGPAADRLESLLRRRRAAERHQTSIFGIGPFDRVYRIGPNRELIGRPVSEFETTQSAGARAQVNGASLLRKVDPASDLVPCYLTGTVTGIRVSREALAIAINGEIAAVTRTYSALGRTRFAAMVPPSALRAGANSVGVFAVRHPGGRPTLEHLGGETVSFTVGVRAGRTVITSSDGKTIRVERGALRGMVRASPRPGTVLFGGWAVDARARRRADWVVVFVGGSSVYTGSASNFPRPDVAKRFGVSEAGFIFELPRTLLGSDLRKTRVFAIRGSVASELPLRR